MIIPQIGDVYECVNGFKREIVDFDETIVTYNENNARDDWKYMREDIFYRLCTPDEVAKFYSDRKERCGE